MFIYAYVPTHEDLNFMLYLQDLYNVMRISIYLIKLPSQISSLSPVETQERCVSNLNEEYIGHEGAEDGGHQFDGLVVEASFPSNNRVPFQDLCNPSSLINHEAIINDFEDDLVMMEDNLDQILREIEFNLRQT